MSLLSMTSIAIARDHAELGQPIQSGRPARTDGALGQPAPIQPETPIQSGTSGSTSGSVAGFAELLVAQIPSEALLAYTTLLALFSVGGSSYNAGRWILYGSAILACAATVIATYLAKRDYGFEHSAHATPTAPQPSSRHAEVSTTSPTRVSPLSHLPYLPTFTAMTSMAVYGLTVPGSPLQFELSGPGFGILSGCLAVAGGVMMAIMAPFLGKGNGAAPTKSAH